MIVEFSVTPIGKGKSLSEDIAQVLDLVDRSGLDYRFTPMGTIVEGEWDLVMQLIKNCHQAMRERVDRVSTRIYIDDQKGAKDRIRHKVEAVEKKLGRKLSG